MIHMSEKPTYEELLKRVLELEKAELENKRNSEALHRSQVMMARTERIANVGSWEWEIATDRVTWSDELFRIFQLDPDEKVPSWAEHSALYHPEDMESLRHAVEASVADGTPYELELRALRKDGEIRVCMACGFAETGPDGRATRLFGSLQDITDRKRAEEEIHNTHHRLSYALKLTTTIISAVPIPLFYKDREGRYIGVNDAFSELMGFTPDYYTGKTVMELWPSEFAEVYHRKDLELMRHPEKQVYEFEVIDKHGIVHQAIWSKNVFRDENGEVAGIVGAFQDITERKRVEEALWQSREILRAVLDNIPVRVFWKDRDLKYLGCNLAFARDAGFEKPEDLAGEDDFAMSWREQAESYRRDDRQVIEDGEPRLLIEEPQTTPSDEMIHLLTSKVPLRDAQGAVIGVLGTYMDITERKRAEEALKDATVRVSLATKAGGVGVWEYDLVHNRLQWDEQMYTLYGISRENFGGAYESWRAGVHPEDIARSDQEVNMALSGEKEFDTEFRVVWPDGTVRHIQALAMVLRDEDGKHLRMIGTNWDITELKRAEEEKVKLQARLQQAQKMEAIGSLAGGIAHDLNNILFPISGLSEILLDDIPPDNPARENIEQIYRSSQRGSELVKQILAFSRQSSPKKLPIRIQPILKEALKLAQATIPRNIEIISHINTDCGMVSADPTQIHQIVMNLITNAYHAVEQTGGTINLELKETEFQKDDLHDITMKSGKYACISISDTGTGIDKTLIDKIFDPYFTTKELGKGTGLGLSVVHGIVKEHGGDIRVYSEVGKGTTFHVYLPLLENATDSNTAAASRMYPTGCERILLVDDEEPIMRMEQMMLERLGYQVTTRISSPDALAAFKANPDLFDLVISDRGMPNMTGDQLAGELISIRPGIPIILCTGFSNDNDVKRAKAMGVKGFLMKPVAIGDLAAMVRKVLDDVEHSHS